MRSPTSKFEGLNSCEDRTELGPSPLLVLAIPIETVDASTACQAVLQEALLVEDPQRGTVPIGLVLGQVEGRRSLGDRAVEQQIRRTAASGIAGLHIALVHGYPAHVFRLIWAMAIQSRELVGIDAVNNDPLRATGYVRPSTGHL